jgi:hypothetical protein
VPDFGLDEDMIWTANNIQREEKRLKHEWTPEQDENGVWVVPEAADNKSYTYRPILNVQLDAETDSKGDGPICKKEDLVCDKDQLIEGKKYLHDYFVPNFGLDHDIVNTQKNI